MTPRRIGFSARYLTEDSDRGLNRYTVNLIKALQAAYPVECVLLTPATLPVHERFRRTLQCPIEESRAPSYIAWEQGGLPLAMRRRRLDLLHVPADDAGTPQWKPCPVVLTCHLFPDKNIADLLRRGVLTGSRDDYMDWFPRRGWRNRVEEWRFRALRALALRAADRIITVSEFARRELQSLYGVPAGKLRVVYEAPAPEFFEPPSPELLAEVRARYALPAAYLLYVGGFDRRKNAEGVLEVYARLRRRGAPPPLVLVAEGGKRARVEGALARQGLTDPTICRVLEGVHGRDLVALYHGATLFLTLSWYETFCFPVMEAMACGLPVVASSFGAIPEILAGAGLTVDPRRPQEAVEAVEALLGDPSRRTILGQQAQARAAQFSWGRTVAQTWAVYEELLGTRRRDA